MQIAVLSIFQNYRDEQDDGDVMRGTRGARTTSSGSPASRRRRAVSRSVLTLMKYGGMTDTEAQASLELFATDVMPRLRAGSQRSVAA